jgi:hypothetical protein
MKKLRIFFRISCFIMGLSFLIFSLFGISIAEQTHKQKCMSSCNEKKLVCFNINADKRMCEVEFKSCVDACEPKEESPSIPSIPPTPQQGSDKNEKPM